MRSGLKLYQDINIVVPPFCYFMAELSLCFIDSLIMIRILNVVVWWLIFLFAHKICSKYGVNKYVLAIFNLCLVVYAFVGYNFYYDYNMVCLLLALIVLYNILNKEFSAPNAVIIAVFCALIVWTKHTMGAVFFLITAVSLLLYHKKDKKFVKNVLLMFGTGIAVSAIFVGYLVYQEVLDDFIDLAFLGAGDFRSNFLFSFGLEWFYFAVLLIAVMIVFFKAEKDKDTYVISLFALGSVGFLYPILDYAHLIPLFLILLILFFKLITKEAEKMNLIVTATGIIVCISFVGLVFLTHKGEKIQSTIPAYRYLPVSEKFEQRLYEIEKYIENVDGEVYIIDKYAMIYSTAMGNNKGYYDFLWNGNTGSRTPLEYVKALEEKDCYILINFNNAEEYQWDSKIHEYVKEHYQYEDELGDWKLYHVK